jgi:hypothetical protein
MSTRTSTILSSDKRPSGLGSEEQEWAKSRDKKPRINFFTLQNYPFPFKIRQQVMSYSFYYSPESTKLALCKENTDEPTGKKA